MDFHFPVDPSKYAAFLAVMAMFAVSPGPAVVLCLRTGLGGRVAAVLAAVAGLNTGTLVWFIGAALGLQVLVTQFPLLFHLLALGGGLYLLWMAYQTYRASRHEDEGHLDLSARKVPDSLLTVFRQGLVVQLLNPKALLFFVAALPPFLDMSRPMPPQMVVFAVTCIGMDIVGMTTYGLGAVTLSRVLTDPRNRQRFDLGVALMLGVIAVMVIVHAITDLWH